MEKSNQKQRVPKEEIIERKTFPIKEEPSRAGLLNIVYYTDPLCCWSWGMEPQWKKLLYEYAGKIQYRYCMGGLLPGWKNYNDVTNHVSTPGQMGPVWMHSGQLSGMPIQYNIWVTDPPASSYPACVAVKCAAIQSVEAEESMLRLLREALMINGRNISQRAVILEVAKQVGAIIPSFDLDVFKADLASGKGKDRFRKDLQEVQYYKIKRYPTLVIKNNFNQAIIIEGYRPYENLIEEIRKLGDLTKTHEQINIEQYKDFWRTATDREIQEIN